MKEENRELNNLDELVDSQCDCPCGDDSSHDDGDDSHCVQGAIIKHNL